MYIAVTKNVYKPQNGGDAMPLEITRNKTENIRIFTKTNNSPNK